MLKVPSFNRCVGFVLNMSKKLLTSEVEASSLMLMLMIIRIMMKALEMKTMTDCHV